MQLKPIMLVFPFPLLAHYLRCIVLARNYFAQYTVLFNDAPAYRPFIDKDGFGVFSCADFDPVEVMRDTRQFSFSWLNESDCDRMFQAQLSVIRSYKPALVLGDMAPTLKMACQQTGVHYLSLINGYMSAHYALHRPVATTHPAYTFSRFIPGFIFRRIAAWQERKAFRAIHKPLASIRHQNCLPGLSNYLQELEGDETLICDQPEVFPQKNLPGSYRFVGPLVYDEDDDCYGMQQSKDGRKTILVTLGSSGEWQKVACLYDSWFADYNIILAGSRHSLPTAAHITLATFVSLSKVLPIVDLLICHGGNGTLNLAYLYKVPFVAVPSIMDQEWNALRFAQLMPGRMLTGSITAKKMQKAIEELTR